MSQEGRFEALWELYGALAATQAEKHCVEDREAYEELARFEAIIEQAIEEIKEQR